MRRTYTILALLLATVDLLPLLGTGIILIPWAVICLLLGQVRLGISLIALYAVTTLVRLLTLAGKKLRKAEIFSHFH